MRVNKDLSMKHVQNILIAVSLAITLSVTTAPSSFAIGDNAVKNDLGMYTVKCHVTQIAPGNPVIGYVVGNDRDSAKKAENEANMFVSNHGPHGTVKKRHCKAQKRYIPTGAYDQNMKPI